MAVRLNFGHDLGYSETSKPFPLMSELLLQHFPFYHYECRDVGQAYATVFWWHIWLL